MAPLYPLGLPRERARYAWPSELTACLFNRNPLTGERALCPTFFPRALCCPCCVLGAVASLIQEEEPLYQSPGDNVCLRLLCAYTCRTGVRGTAVCCCACPCCVPVACILSRYQRLQIAAKYNLPIGNATCEGCCLAPCALTQHYMFLADLKARRENDIAPTALPPPGIGPPDASEADLRLAAMEAELSARSPDVSLRDQVAAATPATDASHAGPSKKHLGKSKSAPGRYDPPEEGDPSGAAENSSFEVAFTGATAHDPAELRELESAMEREETVMAAEEEAAVAADAIAEEEAAAAGNEGGDGDGDEDKEARELAEAEAMADDLSEIDAEIDEGGPSDANAARMRFRDAARDVGFAASESQKNMEKVPKPPPEPSKMARAVEEAMELEKALKDEE